MAKSTTRNGEKVTASIAGWYNWRTGRLPKEKPRINAISVLPKGEQC
jgi:hypothetical protein